VTASFLALVWPPFRVRLARPSSEKAPVSTFPHIKPWGAQRTNIIFGHLRTLRADLFELTLSRFLDDSLFHNHRTTAAIYLRNGFPCRQRIERLAVLERFD